MQSATLTITGARYRLIAEITPTPCDPGKYDWVVRAMHLATSRASIVNQVNAILAAFFTGDFPNDWPWTAGFHLIALWTKRFIELSESQELERIEAALDEDRVAGEWEWGLAQPSERVGYDLCRDIEHSIANRVMSAHETWLTTSELLARAGEGNCICQLGVSQIYFIRTKGAGFVVVDEEHGERILSRAQFFEEYPDAVRCWRWIELTPAAKEGRQP